jgi:hypothetical protein
MSSPITTAPTLFLVNFLAFLSCSSFSISKSPRTHGKHSHLGVPQQLHDSSLIRRESSNFSDHRSHKFSLGRLHALALAGADCFRDRRRGVPFVGSVAEVYHHNHQYLLKRGTPSLTGANHFLRVLTRSLVALALRMIYLLHHQGHVPPEADLLYSFSSHDFMRVYLI